MERCERVKATSDATFGCSKLRACKCCLDVLVLSSLITTAPVISETSTSVECRDSTSGVRRKKAKPKRRQSPKWNHCTCQQSPTRACRTFQGIRVARTGVCFVPVYHCWATQSFTYPRVESPEATQELPCLANGFTFLIQVVDIVSHTLIQIWVCGWNWQGHESKK